MPHNWKTVYDHERSQKNNELELNAAGDLVGRLKLRKGMYRFQCDADLSMPIEQISRFLPPYLDEYDLSPSDTLVYACGHPEMIEDIKDRMLPKGFKIEEERFWKQ